MYPLFDMTENHRFSLPDFDLENRYYTLSRLATMLYMRSLRAKISYHSCYLPTRGAYSRLAGDLQAEQFCQDIGAIFIELGPN